MSWMLLATALVLGDVPSLVVLGVPKDNAAKRATQYMSLGFREAVRKNDKFQLAPLGPLFGDRAINTAELARQAEALTAEGLNLYDNLETDKAEEKFRAALDIYEKNLGEFDSTKAAGRIALL